MFGEADSTPVNCTPSLWRDWHLLIGIFIFTRCLPTPWIFYCAGFSGVSYMDIYLRYTLRSWRYFSPSMIRRFRRGFRSGQWILSIASAQDGVSVTSNLFGDLLYCCRVFECLTVSMAAIFSGGYWFSQSFPLLSGFSEVIGRTTPRLWATYREVWFLTSVVLVLRRRRFIKNDSLLSDGIFSLAVFPHVMWGGEDKIEVIKKFVGSVLLLLLLLNQIVT